MLATLPAKSMSVMDTGSICRYRVSEMHEDLKEPLTKVMCTTSLAEEQRGLSNPAAPLPPPGVALPLPPTPSLVNPVSIKNTKISRAWWRVPVVPTAQDAEVAVSRDLATALQPGQQEQNSISKK